MLRNARGVPPATSFVIDLVAISILAFGMYFPRYRRSDMVLAYLGLNIGVMAVAIALTNTTTIGAGFGLGLFGTLSIIRLRSLELTHQDVAYYFAALALGLIGGIEIDPGWLAVALPATILAAILVGDNPVLFRSYRQQVMVLDRGHRAAGRGAKAGSIPRHRDRRTRSQEIPSRCSDAGYLAAL